MKKVWIVVTLSVVLLFAVAIACVGVYYVNSPEYALMQIIADVTEFGMDGLSPHLTEDARIMMDKVTNVADNELFDMIVGLLSKADYVDILKSKIQETQWSVNDVLKSGDKASAILSFNYEDKLIGSIELSMVREDNHWKIDGLDLPEFDEINW